jgi:hypothetical protein
MQFGVQGKISFQNGKNVRDGAFLLMKLHGVDFTVFVAAASRRLIAFPGNSKTAGPYRTGTIKVPVL